LKLFTQNIDCLEREAGLPGDMIVEAHGSFAKQSCIECKTPYPRDSMEQAIHDKTVPHCLEKNCDGLVKPEIVFFGEQLPADFFNNKDLPGKADLCIVLGTSLSVQPFASLPGLCQEHTPRVLINQEQVGSLGSRADDVLVLGDCDSGVRKLAKACGWLEELEQLWAETVPDQTPTASKDEPAKSKDEALQDEVDQLTKEVEQTLKLGEAQHKWLENHLDNKAARVQEVNKRPTPTEQATREPDGPTTSELETTMRPEALKAEPESEENGLEHVFPHMNKKPSL
jgi:NAD-dependent histone deacetylase SIR2